MYKKGMEGITMNKDIEELKAAGWFFLCMGLSMKTLAARRNVNCSETDTQAANLNDRNDIEFGDISETEFFSNKEI